MSNSSTDPFIYGCVADGYSIPFENFKYAFQFVYLFPGAFLHMRILMIMMFWHRKVYMSQSFFIIFTLDSIAVSQGSRSLQNPFQSLTQIIIDVCIGRVVIYIPQLCPLLFDSFEQHTFIPHLYFTIYSYMRAAKAITQIFSTFNRMTCVIWPLKYGQIWRRGMPLTIALIILSPFLVIWNVIISDVFPASRFAGFTLGYTKTVKWASLSLFQMTFMLIALVITVITTSVTLFKMRRLKNRLISSERTLCIASFYMSFGFLIASVFQSYFSFFNISIALDLVFFLQTISFDILNVGGPVVMILISSQLRNHIIPWLKVARKTSTVVSTSNVSRV